MAISLPGGRNLHVPAVAGIIQEYNIKAELSSASRLQQRPTVEAFTLFVDYQNLEQHKHQFKSFRTQ